MSQVEVSRSPVLFDTVSRAARVVRKSTPSLRIVTRRSHPVEANVVFPNASEECQAEIVARTGVKSAESRVETVVAETRLPPRRDVVGKVDTNKDTFAPKSVRDLCSSHTRSQVGIVAGTGVESTESQVETIVTETSPPFVPSLPRLDVVGKNDTNKAYAFAPKSVRDLRSSHTRSQSAAAVTQSAPSSPSNRTRAASTTSDIRGTSKRPSRIRVSSLAAQNSGVAPKAEAVKPIATGGDDTLGSFAPTSCPRQHLHSLLGTTPRPRFFSTAPRRFNPSTGRSQPPRRQTVSESPSPFWDVPPPKSPIPSICRTPSSYSESEYLPTAPSSAGPQTPIHATMPLPHNIKMDSIPAALAALEDKSRFRVKTFCATCRRPGSNFPCCPRCAEMWCSRECRLKSGNGKRHLCKKGKKSSF